MSKSLSKKKAVKVFSSSLVNAKEKEGICAGSGIPESSSFSFSTTWELNKKNPKLKVTSKGISFNAFHRLVTHSAAGIIATGVVTSSSTSLKPFRRGINFSDLETAYIAYSPDSIKVCRTYIHKGYAEIVMTLSSGSGHWVSTLIKSEDVEKFIAASMILAPKINYKTR